MATNLAGIDKGMDVMDVNGEKVGTVADVLTVQAYSQSSASSGYATSTSDMGTTGYDTGAAGQGSYLKVDQGGILGIGAKELYIPFSAVQNVVPGDNLTVNCAKDACGSMFGTKPEFLS